MFFSSVELFTQYAVGRTQLYFPIKAEVNHSSLKSSLSRTDYSDGNDVSGTLTTLFFNPWMEYQSPTRRFTFWGMLTLKGLMYDASNNSNSHNTNFNRLYADANLNLKYAVSPMSLLQLLGSFLHKTGDIMDLTTNVVQHSYLSQSVKSGIWARSKTSNLGLRHEYKNPLSLCFGYAGISYVRDKQNLIGNQSITPNYILSRSTPYRHTNQSASIEASLYKTFAPAHLKLGLRGTGTWFKREVIQQDVPIMYYGTSLSVSPNLLYTPSLH